MLRTAVATLIILVFACICAHADARPVQRGGQSCRTQIPSCRSGRCVSQKVEGSLQSVCQACKAGYVKSQSGLHCVCPSGFYEQCSSAAGCQCVQCEQAFYCEGGNMKARNRAKASERGVRRSCHKNEQDAALTTAAVQAKGMTTAAAGAKRQSECLTMPGFVMTENKDEAVPCLANSFSEGLGRGTACAKCAGSFEEDPLFTTQADATPGLRKSKDYVCRVPPGMYTDDWGLRDCPVGSFRSGYEAPSSSSARSCFACPKGVTTQKSRSTSQADCNCKLWPQLTNTHCCVQSWL